jgi:hypothetical protein
MCIAHFSLRRRELYIATSKETVRREVAKETPTRATSNMTRGNKI